MNIYLDVEGTLIHEELAKYNQPALHLRAFFEALLPYPVYWLTTHCREGNSAAVQLHLSKLLEPEVFQYALRYEPTTWSELKTEAIDFSTDFLWFDDYTLETERAILAQHNALGNLIEMNLAANPHQLAEIVRDVL